MQIAITGATGFLGRYLVRHLAGLGHQLRCWHRPTSDRSGFEGLGGNAITWLEGQLGDPARNGYLSGGSYEIVTEYATAGMVFLKRQLEEETEIPGTKKAEPVLEQRVLQAHAAQLARVEHDALDLEKCGVHHVRK